MNNPILFYSKHDKCSITVFTLLHKFGLLSSMKLICVDEDLKKYIGIIDSVPTLFVTVSNNTQILKDKEIFKWIETINYVNNNKSFTKDSSTYIGWNPAEMGGRSDNYAWKDEKKNEAFSQSYIGAGKNNEMIFTAKPSKKLNRNDTSKLQSNLLKLRSEHDNEIANNNKLMRYNKLMELKNINSNNNYNNYNNYNNRNVNYNNMIRYNRY